MLHILAAALLFIARAQASPSPAPQTTAMPPASPAPQTTAMPPASPAPQTTAMPQASPAPQQPAMPPANFGSPPSGEIPILFNDHHVYANPDRLVRGRVLAALVRGNTILVPLRSLFEQTGATVSYDPSKRTVHVSKPGADVLVTVGVPQVVINGESRPLDVPPEIYHGTILVPLRVISEGMGAYVQWVPEKRLVVVRYVVATPPPPPPPTPVPPPPATPAPTPVPTAPPSKKEIFLIGDYAYGGKVSNEFAAQEGVNSSYNGRVGGEFDLFSLPLMAEADFRQYQYQHPDGFVTTIGGLGSTFVPAFRARDNDTDVRLAIKVVDPRIYVGGSWLFKSNNYGYPNQNGFGFGAEKLPDADQAFSIYGSYWYYPNIHGTFVDPFGTSFNVEYGLQKYQIGGTIKIPSTPIFVDLGFMGDRGNAKNQSPIGYTHNAFYTGLGVHF